MTFEADGAVHLRGVFDLALIERLSAAAQAIIAQRPSFDRPKLPVRDIIIDGVPGDVALMAPAILDIARVYFGREPVPCGISNVRRMLPDGRPLHFHQDETILGHRLLNIWVPLTPCGVDAPGLEVVRGSFESLLETDSIPDSPLIADRHYIPEQRVLDRFPSDALYTAAFEPGDAMVFAGSTIHRTHLTPGMSRPRFSVELRLM